MGAAGTAHVQTGWVGVPLTPGRARLTDTEDDQWGAIWARSGHSHQGGGGGAGRGGGMRRLFTGKLGTCSPQSCFF